MKVKVPYLTDQITIELDSRNLLAVLEPNDVKAEADCETLVRKSLGPSFDEFLKKPGDLLVIVNDGTRPTPTRLVLDAIADKLEKASAAFIIATGGHRAPTQEEYNFIFGSHYSTFKDRILVHDAKAKDGMKYYGKTRRGTELYLNSAVAQAGKVLVIGSVEPHYFAGYTGGRKAFLPGTAAYISIEQNHKLALSDDACALALEGNPVHEDMMEAVELITSPVYSIQTVLDREQKINAVCSGSLADSFNRAVEAANRIFTVPISEKTDIVISAARYPMDIDLYQSQKAVDNASLALKDGGTLILVSSCRDGIGGDAFFKLLSSAETPRDVAGKIEAGYKLGYHKAAKMANVFCRAEVKAFSKLDDETLKKIFITPVRDLQKALDEALHKYGKDAKVIIMPDGSVTVPLLKK